MTQQCTAAVHSSSVYEMREWYTQKAANISDDRGDM